MTEHALPRILVIDDLFGRQVRGGLNTERSFLCGHLLLSDVTGDDDGNSRGFRVATPIAEAVFARAQRPVCAVVGDVVENDLDGALDAVEAGWRRDGSGGRWALALLDLTFLTGSVTRESNARSVGMPEGRTADSSRHSLFGLSILAALQERFPELPVAVLSSIARDEVSLEFSRLGAVAFLGKDDPGAPDRLREILFLHGLVPDDAGEIIGSSVPLLLALRAARRASATRRSVLIRGERGAGKELVARFLHRQPSSATAPARASEALVVVDSGSISSELFASTLFGHRRGAFTGASSAHDGLIVRADGGDLFLDEIANMPQNVQAGLLRVLATKEVLPVGASSGVSVDVRFLAATNEDVEMTGRLREDLLDRLREGGTIVVPALRERPEDLPALVSAFLRRAEADLRARRRQIDPAAMGILLSHLWPGNVRELASSIYAAVHSYPDVEYLVPAHLDAQLRFRPVRTGREVRGTSERPIGLELVQELLGHRPFGVLPPERLVGVLPSVQETWAGVTATLVRSALVATRRPSVRNPEGDVLIHPAMKLLTGDASLSASKAADLVKRLLGEIPDAFRDPLLDAALERALRLRPSRPAAQRARAD